MVQKIINTYSKDLRNSKKLSLLGSGGAMMHDVKKIHALYSTVGDYNIDDARQLYTEVIEGYLQRVNNNEELRPFLHNYPFDINNLKIIIGFMDETNQHQSNGKVAVIGYNKTKKRIYYETYNNTTKQFEPLLQETYEEALAIVQKQKACDLQQQ